MVKDKPVIQLLGISKAFTTEEVRTHALSEVSLSIAGGEYIAISGPSGCGKSTLLSILGLLDTPTSGEYRLNGEPVTALSAPSGNAALTSWRLLRATPSSSSHRSTGRAAPRDATGENM